MACPAMGACFWFARSEDANRATAPQRRNQQSCELLVSPRESPRGTFLPAARGGGRALRKRRAYFFVSRSGEAGVCAPSGTRTAAQATAACGGNREAEQGQRSQRASPAQGAPPDAGTATRTVPAVQRPRQQHAAGGENCLILPSALWQIDT